MLDCEELPDLAAQWEELRWKETKLHKQFNDVEAKISEAELHAELGKKLLNQLQSIGKQIVQEIPSLHQCPLCGTKNIGAKTILFHLEQEQDIYSEELSQLYQEKKKLEGIEFQLARQQKVLRQLGETADTVNAAFKAAQNLFPQLAVGEPLKTVKRVLEEIQLQKHHKDQLKQLLAREKKYIKALYFPKRSKISLEDILTVEDRVRELFLRNNYPECGVLSGKMLQERVLDIFKNWSGKKMNWRTIFPIKKQSGMKFRFKISQNSNKSVMVN